MDFAVPSDYQVKRKETIDKYLDLVRELTIVGMDLTVIPFVDSNLGTTPNGLEKRLEDLKIRS